MSFLTHFSLFSQSYVCYIYIILQIFSKSKCKAIKNKTQVSILSLLRLISGIYVVFNLNNLYMYAITYNDCLSFSHAISLPIKILEMRGKLSYVLCKFFIFFYLYIFSSNVIINSMQFSKVMLYSIKIYFFYFQLSTYSFLSPSLIIKYSFPYSAPHSIRPSPKIISLIP